VLENRTHRDAFACHRNIDRDQGLGGGREVDSNYRYRFLKNLQPTTFRRHVAALAESGGLESGVSKTSPAPHVWAAQAALHVASVVVIFSSASSRRSSVNKIVHVVMARGSGMCRVFARSASPRSDSNARFRRPVSEASPQRLARSGDLTPRLPGFFFGLDTGPAARV